MSTIPGTSGNDRLEGTSASETIQGGAGDDLIINIGGGRDLFDGGDGNDTLRTPLEGVGAEDVVLFDIANGIHGRANTNLGRDTIESIENFEVTGDWDVRALGDDGDNRFVTDEGNDTLDGGRGNDTLEGGTGNDLYEFGSRAPGNGVVIDTGGDDTLRMEDTPERDALKFYVDGNDFVRVSPQGFVTTLVDGVSGPGQIEFATWFRDGDAWFEETGNDVSSYESQKQIITSTDQATSDSVLLAGTEGDDVLALPNLGTGNARFVEVYGNDGNDELAIQSSLYSLAYGGEGDDTITGTTNIGQLLGDGGDDRLIGRSGEETIAGGPGQDVLEGRGGNDNLFGGEDNDTIDGGAGNDYLNPGSGGFDWIYPGTGNDTIDMRDAGDFDYAITFYNDAASALVADFDIATDTGTVTTDDFVDEFLGLVAAANPWGFGLAGTQNDDVFNITQIDNGFTYIQGQGGADTYNIDVSSGGTVRIDFTFGDSGIFQGIDADLATGVIVDGGGFVDQLNLTQGAGTFVLEAGRLNDTVSGSAASDHVRGGDGDDTVQGLGGNDSLRGDAGNDSLEGGGGADTLDGGEGNDILEGGRGNDDYIYAFEGDDVIRDTGGSDDQIVLFTINEDGDRQLANMERVGDDLVIIGTDGRGTLTVEGAFDTDTGVETLLYRAADGRWDGLPESDFLTTLLPVSAPTNDTNSLVVGGDGDDLLTVGNGAFNDFFGGAGNDTMLGSGNADFFYDGSGNDSINGGNGDDVWFSNTGEDTFNGGEGRDRFVIDISSFTPQQFVVETNLATGESGAVGLPQGRDTLIDVEDYSFTGDFDVIVTGSDADNRLQTDVGEDTLTGDDGNDRLESGGGNDTASGGFGDDTVEGGDGDDLLRGNAGEDEIFGGDGNDQLRGQKNGDLLDGGNGNDNIKGGGGNDTLFGGDGRDFLNGGTRADSIVGGDGNDNLIGRSFDDTLVGGAGNDRLNAGGDDDEVEGGAGNDFIKAGDGADSFFFNDGFELDRLDDFDIAEDRLFFSNSVVGGLDAGEVAALAAQNGADVDIDLGDGNIVRFLKTDVDDLAGLDAVINIF